MGKRKTLSVAAEARSEKNGEKMHTHEDDRILDEGSWTGPRAGQKLHTSLLIETALSNAPP